MSPGIYQHCDGELVHVLGLALHRDGHGGTLVVFRTETGNLVVEDIDVFNEITMKDGKWVHKFELLRGVKSGNMSIQELLRAPRQP